MLAACGVLIAAVLLASTALVLVTMWAFGQRPKSWLKKTLYWRRFIALVAVPSWVVGLLVLVTTRSLLLAGAGALLALALSALRLIAFLRDARRLGRGDAAYARAIVTRLSDTRPGPREDAQGWTLDVIVHARLLATARFFDEARALLDLLRWDRVLEDHCAMAAAALCLCDLARDDVPAARAALARGQDTPASKRDALYRVLELRLTTYDPLPIRSAGKLADTDAIVSAEPRLHAHALAYRAHGAAALGDEEAARRAIDELFGACGREIAVAVLTVPAGPASVLALDFCAQGYR